MTLQEKLLDIKELYIYNVHFQYVDSDSDFNRETFMFLDYDKAMDYAFGLAKKIICKKNKMPICYVKYIKEDNNYETDYHDNEDYADNEPVNIDNIIKSECYIWNHIDHFIFVTTSKLEFNNDIINTTYINEFDENLLLRYSLSQLNKYVKK
jgi:hypothetical protein